MLRNLRGSHPKHTSTRMNEMQEQTVRSMTRVMRNAQPKTNAERKVLLVIGHWYIF